MIEEYFMNYGVLGMWTLSLIYERVKFQKDMMKKMTELTNAIKSKLIKK
jgi:hypothetical protein